MKKSIIAFALVVGFITPLFANHGEKPAKKAKAAIEAATAEKRDLTEDEQQLKERLTEELAVSLTDVLETAEEEITRIEVYNTSGEIIQIQAQNIDFDHLPKGASRLMKEGKTAIYMVF